MTSLPMTSSGEILSTFGTMPITVSTPMPASQRNCPTSSPAFSPLFLAVPAQYAEFPRDLRARAQATGVGVAGDEPERLLLAVSADHDRRMGPCEALRQV